MTTAGTPRLIARVVCDDLDVSPETEAWIDAQVALMPPATAEQIAATNALLRPHLNRTRKTA